VTRAHAYNVTASLPGEQQQRQRKPGDGAGRPSGTKLVNLIVGPELCPFGLLLQPFDVSRRVVRPPSIID